MYYYGLNRHIVDKRREGTILFFPEIVTLSSAAENNLTVFKNEYVPHLAGKIILTNMIYSDFYFFDKSNLVRILTPHKEIKGETNVFRKREKSYQRLAFTGCIKSQTTYRVLFQLVE